MTLPRLVRQPRARTGTQAVAEVGLGTAKVWALYLAGSQLAFERNGIQLHQILGVKVPADGNAQFPLRPTWGG